MKIKQILLTTLSATLMASTLISCGGAGSANPAANTQYGRLMSAHELHSIPHTIAEVATKFTESEFNAGFTPNSDEAGAIMNVVNAATLYKFPNAVPTADDTAPQKLIDFIEDSAAKVGVSEVHAYAITYNTPGVAPETNPADISRRVSGLVIVPKIDKPRGIVVFYHGTTWGKNDVPSCIAEAASSLPEYCNIADYGTAGTSTYNQLAAVYAARGFVVVAPDYVGQGSDYTAIHPYVAYPANNALAGINMVPAARKLLEDKGLLAPDAHLPLFITGYSEGGAYALKASQLAQTSAHDLLEKNHMQLLMTAPAEGAYSLNTQMLFAFADLQDGLMYGGDPLQPMTDENGELTPLVKSVNGFWKIGSVTVAAAAKPLLLGYVLTAIMEYSFHNLSGAYSQVMYDEFWQSFPMGNGINMNLYQLFSTPSLTSTDIRTALFLKALTVNNFDTPISPSLDLFLAGMQLGPYTLPANTYGAKNSALAFVHKEAPQTPQFKQIVQDGSTYQWQTQSPINFIHMTYDSVVTVKNSEEAYTYMHSQAAPGLVAETVIPNNQLVNVVSQLMPMTGPVAKFWAPLSSDFANLVPDAYKAILPQLAQPNDHSDSISSSVAAIIALCSFENAIKDHSMNSGVCPTF